MRLKLVSALILTTLSLAACSDKPVNSGIANNQSSTGATINITGAGASFPQPVYAQWATAYQKDNGTQVNYQSIGSSGGIKQIIAKTVDFSASDAPLSKEELEKDGLIQFPTVIGGVVPVINVDGIEPGKLKLDGPTLANIYLGKISKWNDAALKALNPDLQLPDAAITTVFRSDGSGTTFNFTSYLTKADPDWAKAVGTDKAIKWPTASSGAAGKGNEGVAAYVGRVKNSIGYVEYAYAEQNKMTYVSLKNKAGHFVLPSQETFAAAANVDWKSSPNFNLVLTDQDGENAWPIAAATFILVQKTATDPAKSKAVLSFFDWAYKNGNEAAAKLDYVPLPDSVKSLIREEWKQVKDSNGNAIY